MSKGNLAIPLKNGAGSGLLVYSALGLHMASL